MKKISVGVTECGDIIGIKKTKTWQLISAGELDTFKVGRRTLVTTASIKEFVRRAGGGKAQ